MPHPPRPGHDTLLQALSGHPAAYLPLAPVTWGFDYSWKILGVEPWQLAFGDSDTWHRAHLVMLERHGVDALFYMGAGTGPAEPTLLEETRREWRVRDGNTGALWGLLKDSITAYPIREDGGESQPTAGAIRSREDVERAVPQPSGEPGDVYLDGLTRLIREVGERALVLPIYSPGYIIACYALGFERAMETMELEPELFAYACERAAAGEARQMERFAQAGAEAVYTADSWASCDIISPQQFARFALPCQRSVTVAAQAAGLKAILWNLGDIVPVLPLEAELPVDAFAFEQPRKGFSVSVAQVREAFGPARCLFGNLDSEALLLRNDPEEIAREVAEQVRQAGRDTPFVLSTGSPLPSDLDPAAVDAMLAAARALSD